MRSRVIGGILLIVGTSIGGGMLALPVVNAATGFWISSLYLILCWSLMTLGALYILEVNLYLPPGKNMISMAGSTLGIPGLILAWLSYLFLLYTLLSAYISGGADVLGGLLSQINVVAPQTALTILFTLLFGFIVYGGIHRVDLINRWLMFAKLGVYLLLVILITPLVHFPTLQSGHSIPVPGSLMVLITSFGYAIIIPNLRTYFNDEVITLKKVVLLGSLIPLFCYILWDAIILGSLPTSGAHGLLTLMTDEHATSTLAHLLSNTVRSPLISTFFHFFTAICMLTAFLGVSLCLISFLGDGLHMTQHGLQGLGLFILTFLPPLLVVIYYPGVYINALSYAGICCVILLLLLPALMSYIGRPHATTQFVVPGGQICQWIVMIASLILLILSAR